MFSWWRNTMVLFIFESIHPLSMLDSENKVKVFYKSFTKAIVHIKYRLFS